MATIIIKIGFLRQRPLAAARAGAGALGQAAACGAARPFPMKLPASSCASPAFLPLKVQFLSTELPGHRALLARVILHPVGPGERGPLVLSGSSRSCAVASPNLG